MHSKLVSELHYIVGPVSGVSCGIPPRALLLAMISHRRLLAEFATCFTDMFMFTNSFKINSSYL